MMIGPIRQELLAARFFSQCRRRGVQGSNTDFLICATAARRKAHVFSTDRDFAAFERMLDVKLHQIGE
jgi:predicted nucleic acid-binding protein